MHSPYHDKNLIDAAVNDGRHREVIGGMWDAIGALQFDYLLSNGLKPTDILLDIGCGSLRLGHLAVKHLDVGNYFGTDINETLLDAGFLHEIADKSRLPRENLVVDMDFGFVGIPQTITRAIACSVFTHLPMNFLRRCLLQMHSKFPALDTFYFTVFLAPDAHSSLLPVAQAGGIHSHDTKDPYHFLEREVHFIARECGYDSQIFDWNHPRNQKMVVVRPRR